MKPPRGLSAAEAALWERVAATVSPLHANKYASTASAVPLEAITAPPPPFTARPKPKTPAKIPEKPLPVPGGLDASWDRKLARAAIAPDFTIDLHGYSLDRAHARLDTGLAQAAAMGARLVLLITGRPRPSEDGEHGRGERRGAIRSKIVDWLAAGPHASSIAAVRGAHPRHGGAGALYIVLRRRR